MARVPYLELCEFLEQLRRDCTYVVVKNPDLWASLRRGGDWDLLVADPVLAESTLVRTLGVPRRVSRRSYVVSYYFDWGQIDLLPCLEWRGVRLIETDRCFSHSQPTPDGWPAASTAHQAVMGWVGPLLASGAYKERYRHLVARAAQDDREEFRRLLVLLFGRRLGRDMLAEAESAVPASPASVSRLRLAAWLRALETRPLTTVRRMGSFVYDELRLRLRPALPFVRVESAAELVQIVNWCKARKGPVPGLAVLTEDCLRVFPNGQNVPPGLATFAGPSMRAHRGQFVKSAHRMQLAKLQASGWLTVSLRRTSGSRMSPSALLGSASRIGGEFQHPADILDGLLREYVSAELGAGSV